MIRRPKRSSDQGVDFRLFDAAAAIGTAHGCTLAEELGLGASGRLALVVRHCGCSLPGALGRRAKVSSAAKSLPVLAAELGRAGETRWFSAGPSQEATALFLAGVIVGDLWLWRQE